MKKESYSVQDAYQVAVRFAAEKHGIERQKVPGTNLPYLMHLSNVAMEILVASSHMRNMDISYAVQVALLHDTLEDTPTSKATLKRKFGSDVAGGVDALTKKKNKRQSKEEKMKASLERIKQQPREVWCVKLADRITNLQKPPESWNIEKRNAYATEAVLILTALRGANRFLEKRLEQKIKAYRKRYCK